MNTFAEPVEQVISDQLKSLDEERNRLQQALETIRTGSSTPPRKRSSASAATSAPKKTSRRGPKTSRAARGGKTRAEEALEFVKNNPGASSVEVAKGIDISPGHAYQVMGKLNKEGLVTKDGSAYTAV